MTFDTALMAAAVVAVAVCLLMAYVVRIVARTPDAAAPIATVIDAFGRAIGQAVRPASDTKPIGQSSSSSNQDNG